MARTALLYVVPALLVVAGWLRLEDGAAGGSAIFLAALALLPALVPSAWARVLAAAAAAAVAAWHVFGLSVLDARPFDERDYFGPLLASIGDGFLAYYDVPQPFAVAEEPLMHGVLLMAIFGFCLAVALALAARRPIAASLVLVAGAAWPVTLVPQDGDLVRGALLLSAVLAILAAGGRRAPRAYRPALVAGAILVLAAAAAGTMPAVAKGEFLGWRSWDFYDAPADPVGVDYVWDATYDGIEFPKEETTVLTVTGPRRRQYWRASTLDAFENGHWIEDLTTIARVDDTAILTRDPLLPRRGRNPENWIEAEVRIEALRDDHLVGPSVPVLIDPGSLGAIDVKDGGVATVDGGLERGDEYTITAYAPTPSPEQLARIRSTRGIEQRYLEVARRAATLPFGSEGREERIDDLARETDLGPYLTLYDTAREIVGEPANPYAAVVALETWFRSQGGFVYDEQPPNAPGGPPPLVDFVNGHKRGYCQYFAGAMTLMLRYLGIPSRVAVGFTGGTYDADDRRWTVTDHDAHAWVEVWFPGWGWLPFDPTPTRGGLGSPYSTASQEGASTAIQQILRQSFRGGLENSPLGRFAEGATGSPLGDVIPPGLGGSSGALTQHGESLLRLLALVGITLVGAIAVAKDGRRRIRHFTRDPRKVAAGCRHELADYLADQGVVVPKNATTAEVGRSLEDRVYVDAEPFVQAVDRARFAPPDEARAAARDARRELRALRKEIRARLRAIDRAFGLVSVRSLGF